MCRRWISGVVCGLLAAGVASAARPANTPDAGTTSKSQRGGASANAQSSAPKIYENAEHKFRFKAPGNWTSTSGGPTGSLYNLGIPPDPSSLPKFKPGEGVIHIFGDMFTIVVTPAKDPAEDLAAAVADVKEQIKKDFRNAEFKPVEKAKVAGQEAAVLTASMLSDKPGEPKIIHRHMVLVRGGEVFQIGVWAHENTLTRDTRILQNISKSFEWTGPAATTRPAPATAPAHPAAAAPKKPAAPAKPKSQGNDGLE